MLTREDINKATLEYVGDSEWKAKIKASEQSVIQECADSFVDGAQWAQQTILARASKGFGEWAKDIPDISALSGYDKLEQIIGFWQTAKLSTIAEIDRLKAEIKQLKEKQN